MNQDRQMLVGIQKATDMGRQGIETVLRYAAQPQFRGALHAQLHQCLRRAPRAGHIGNGNARQRFRLTAIGLYGAQPCERGHEPPRLDGGNRVRDQRHPYFPRQKRHCKNRKMKSPSANAS